MIIAERLYTLTLWDDPETIRLSQQAPCTRLRCDGYSRQTSARLFIPESGFPITSIRSGGGVQCGTMIDGPSRPSLPLRRTVPSARTHLTDLSASQGAIAVLLST